MGLTAATALGDNAVQMLEGIAGALRAAGVEIEHRLSPDRSSSTAAEVLGDVDVGWACGLLTRDLIGEGAIAADVVAAPVFVGEAAPVYHSVVLGRRSGSSHALHHRRLVVNERASWSGHYALSAHLVEQGLPHDAFQSIRVSGSHQQSIAALLANEADVAAIDHTVWRHIAGAKGIDDVIEVVDRTRDWPSPPFMVNRRLDAAERARLVGALTAIPSGRVSGLQRIVEAAADAYAVLPDVRSSLPSLV